MIELPIIAAGFLAWDALGLKNAAQQESPTDIEMDKPANRGRVLVLSAMQRVNRWLYLAGELSIDALDPFVRSVHAPRMCPTIFYRLSVYNGGKDPTAPDCATRWKKSGSDFINITSDCMGGAAWGAGFDRYQPARFAHIYEGWINTDSMIADALGPAKCFRALTRPEPGCFIVAASGIAGHAVGHIGGVVSVPASWRGDPESYRSLGVVDVAARDGRANKRTSGAGWAGRDASFIVSKMQP